jgi:hypothetical protein
MEIEPSNKAFETVPNSFRVPRLSHNIGIVTTAKQALQESALGFSSFHFMESLPRKKP